MAVNNSQPPKGLNIDLRYLAVVSNMPQDYLKSDEFDSCMPHSPMSRLESKLIEYRDGTNQSDPDVIRSINDLRKV